MSVIWWILIVIVLAFALFAGDSTVRMRSDVKLIREMVMDMRSKIASRWSTDEPADAETDDDDSTSGQAAGANAAGKPSSGQDVPAAPATDVAPVSSPAGAATGAGTASGIIASASKAAPATLPPPVQENFRDWHP